MTRILVSNKTRFAVVIFSVIHSPMIQLKQFAGGNPEESVTQEIEVPKNILRTPRAGDLLENLCS